MGPEGSLQCSQEPTTCPYPEPDQVNQRPLILFLQDTFYYYPNTYAWVSPPYMPHTLLATLLKRIV
jgi:hypothetical protein